jgi:glycosyltransferase involved in cell wall biosynthesis
LRILHIIASADPRRGGPIEGVRQLAEGGKEWGQLTHVVTFDAPGQSFLDGNPFQTIALGPSPMTYGYTRRLAPWLRTHARDYDAIIVNGLWQYNGYAALRIVRPLGKPYFVFPHGMLDPWFKHAYPFKHLKKRLYWELAEREVLRNARAVFFTCEEERQLARQTFPGFECNALVTGYGSAGPTLGRDQCVAEFLGTFPALEGRRLLLFLGRLHEKKGCDLLLDAFASIAGRDPTLHLVVAGPTESPLYAQLRGRSESRGVADRVTWTGMLSGTRKWGALYAADLFVLPSHQENFGIAVVEALACGTPVAITDKVNIWREILAEGAGMVGADTVDGVRDVLQRWVATGPQERTATRARARRCFEARFEVRGVAQRFHDTLSGLVAS